MTKSICFVYCRDEQYEDSADSDSLREIRLGKQNIQDFIAKGLRLIDTYISLPNSEEEEKLNLRKELINMKILSVGFSWPLWYECISFQISFLNNGRCRYD